MIDKKVAENMIKGIQQMNKNLLDGVKKTYENMSTEEGQQFIKALQDGGIEKQAQENAKLIVEANKLLGEK